MSSLFFVFASHAVASSEKVSYSLTAGLVEVARTTFKSIFLRIEKLLRLHCQNSD